MKRAAILLSVLVMGCGASTPASPTAVPSIAAAASPTAAATPVQTPAPSTKPATPPPTPTAIPTVVPMTTSEAAEAYILATVRYNIALIGVHPTGGTASCAEMSAFGNAAQGLMEDLDAVRWPTNVATAIASARSEAQSIRNVADQNVAGGDARCNKYGDIFAWAVSSSGPLAQADDAIRKILHLLVVDHVPPNRL